MIAQGQKCVKRRCDLTSTGEGEKGRRGEGEKGRRATFAHRGHDWRETVFAVELNPEPESRRIRVNRGVDERILMNDTTINACINCGRDENQVPVAAWRMAGRTFHICPDCLPMLIHHRAEVMPKRGLGAQNPGQ